MPPRNALTPSGELTGHHWTSGPVAVGVGFSEKWKGLRPEPRGFGFLLRARSVHSMGMRVPLLVIAIDNRGEVVRVTRLAPGRIFIAPTARHILELPIDAQPPLVGMALTWHGVGPPDRLRYPNRQPG